MTLYLVASLVFLLSFLSHINVSASVGDTGDIKKTDFSKQLFMVDTTTSFDTLFQHCLTILYNNPDSTRKLIQKAFTYNLFDNQVQKARSLNLLGVTHHLQANYIKALDYYYEALSLAVELNDNNRIADIYNNVGNVNLKIGNYKEALDAFLKATKYYNDLGLTANEASVLNNIGLLYMDIKNFDKARSHFRQAYHGFEVKNDSIGMAATLSNIGILFDENENADSAFFYINRAIGINTRTDNKYGLCISLQAKANTFFTKRMYEQAIGYYYKSNAVAQSINHSYQKGFTYLGLSNAQLKTGEIKTALQNAGLAMQIADEINNIRLKQETHESLAQIYEAEGDFKKALEHFRTSVDLKAEMINQTKLHQIYTLEIQQLSQAKEIQQLEIQRQELLLNQKNTIILFIVVAFLLIIVGVYLYYHNYRYRQRASLQETIISLTEKKSRAAVEAEIQERKRIGQELHDGLGQMLSVARLNISVLQQKSSLTEERKKELLDAAIYSVDKAFYELRDISHNLAPSILTEKGFLGALKELSDQINQSKLMKVHLETYGLNGSLDNLIENTLYRAVQELLNNAIKHAKATNFYLQLVKSDSEITLMVEDNGIGFNMDEIYVLEGGGLRNIRSRVENLSGSVFVDAMADRGTIITIVIPLKTV